MAQQFRHDYADQTTMLNGLPNTNDVFPQVTEHPNVQGLSRQMAGVLRERWQSAHNKTPLHVVTYNMMSSNYFNNQYFQQAVYYATNLVALIMSQGEDFQSAFNKSVSYIYKGYIALALAGHQHVAQMMNPNAIQEAQFSANKLNQLIGDVNHFMQSGQQPMQPNMGYQQPNMGYQQPMMGGNSAVSRATQGGHQQQPRNTVPAYSSGPRTYNTTNDASPSPAQASRGVIQSIYSQNATSNEKNGSTVQEWSTHQQQPAQQGVPMQEPTQPSQAPNMVDLDRTDIPLKVEDIVFNPYHYIPNGVEIDDANPYDVIYIPGGSVLELRFKSQLKLTKGSASPYPNAVQPDLFCTYLHEMPDGCVGEYIIEWRDDMEYAKHQLIAELRGTDVNSDGIMTPHTTMVAVTKETPTTVEILKSKYGEDISETDVLKRPIFIEGIFSSSSDAEDEEMVQRAVLESLGWDRDSDTVPSHVYLTERLYPIDVESEAIDRLFALMTAQSLEGFIRGIRELLKDELLPVRAYRIINERMTVATNLALHDNLSIDPTELSITNFFTDYDDLIDVLRNEPEYEGMADVFEAKSERIITAAMTLRLIPDDDEDENSASRLYIVDQRCNYRVGFEIAELVDITEKNVAHLVSRVNSPNISALIDKFIKFARAEKKLPGRFYIVTADGVYLEILIGWLGSNNLLIKRIN